MSHISYLAVLISTLSYLIVYILLFSKLVVTEAYKKANPNLSLFSSEKLILVLLCGFVFSFFLALFMLMAERNGLADGMKSGFMLTFAVFCIPSALYFRILQYTWEEYFKICIYFLISNTVGGAMIGMWS